MNLYSLWINKLRTGSRYDINTFLQAYYADETEVYKKILSAKEDSFSGTAAEFGEKYGLQKVQIAGFIDGINTSLETPVDLEKLEEDTRIEMKIVWKSLYENMIKAKADWLWGLEEWDGIYTKEERDIIAKEYKASRQAVSTKIGRNDPCPCGSGKKYKNCCMP